VLKQLSFPVFTAILSGLLLSTSQASNTQGWVDIASGMQYREIFYGPHNSQRRVHQIRFKQPSFQLRLLWAKDYKASALTAYDFWKASKASIVINGGYFDRDLAPMGYQRDQKRVVSSTVWKEGLFGGVFAIPKAANSRALVLGREEFRPQDYSFAVQCGPRLIYQDKAISGIHADPAARRTTIGVDRAGRILLLASDIDGALTFAQTQDLLLSDESKGGLNARGMLNLDGGSSTQMSIHTAQLNKEIIGFAQVPVAVGVFAR
jgi:uncharacterized protein YigE (DUF2233 family)